VVVGVSTLAAPVGTLTVNTDRRIAFAKNAARAWTTAKRACQRLHPRSVSETATMLQSMQSLHGDRDRKADHQPVLSAVTAGTPWPRRLSTVIGIHER
jgi:hypothetical protein